jgi:predicted O-methyltransferase YrrM
MASYFNLQIQNLINKFNQDLLPHKNLPIFKDIERIRQEIYQSKLFADNPKKKSARELIDKDSTPPQWGRFLFNIVKECKFSNCLELGTCLGFSTAYIAAGLSPKGRLTSIEGLLDRAQIAKKSLKKLNLKNIEVIPLQFSQALPDILAKNLFDFVFIDGHHKKDATLRYFDMIYPQLDKNALVIIDDIHWPTEMQPAWDIINKDRRIKHTYTIKKWGIGLIQKSG